MEYEKILLLKAAGRLGKFTAEELYIDINATYARKYLERCSVPEFYDRAVQRKPYRDLCGCCGMNHKPCLPPIV